VLCMFPKYPCSKEENVEGAASSAWNEKGKSGVSSTERLGDGGELREGEMDI